MDAQKQRDDHRRDTTRTEAILDQRCKSSLQTTNVDASYDHIQRLRRKLGINFEHSESGKVYRGEEFGPTGEKESDERRREKYFKGLAKE